MDVVVGGTSCMNRVPSNYGTLKSADGALLGIGETNAPRTHVESLLQAGCILCHTRLAESAGCLGIRWPSASIQPKVKSSAGSATRKPYRAKCQTETRPILSGYFACNFKSLRGDATCKPRKPRHNTWGIKSFKINSLRGGGVEVRQMILILFCKSHLAR